VAGIAARTDDRCMVHRIRYEACRGIRVAVATLHDTGRNMRRRSHPGGGGAVVATRAIGVRGLVDVSATRPTGETGRRLGVTGDAVASGSHNVAGVRCGTLRTFSAFARVGAVVAGVAAGRAHR
jgi:hypothetical protein